MIVIFIIYIKDHYHWSKFYCGSAIQNVISISKVEKVFQYFSIFLLITIPILLINSSNVTKTENVLANTEEIHNMFAKNPVAKMEGLLRNTWTYDF